MSQSIQLPKRVSWLRSHLLLSIPYLRLVEFRADLSHGTMGRYHERSSTFFTRLTYYLNRKPRSTIGRSPAPQTSPSTSPCVTPLDRMPMYSTPLSQFANSQTRSSFPFSPMSPRTRGSAVTTHGSVSRIVWATVIATIAGCSFYDRSV